ncbi:AIG2 protein-like [Arabidopsis thaliana]|uniref:Protein AIG2 A n=2 Tax=Arabidopsis thaliana TaxID=3702 RepID=AIG2A_ARATH|nr:AIG2-like (avirulence induced gene) family protein [Arabidopsis thaliana]NP_189535.1 AIG2-like (avirulence induced gene) family protein [Arabidopsis thaliana]P54121.1 RecName: Full=Protein AIG2 A; AltName: Full=Avirulence-induced gene 2 protein; AltName: Full=Avirulence-induced gene 2 protein A; AltName: Full=AvrRpt2-induced gene 2; AltName: Full=Protein AIG2; AltName: Full=Putative gamma-glutamylcyclotransferase [Arabidopsis thaliana]AAC49283.1 AIG2 [Arabidopsis thaliana]AAK49606.1 AT3g2893|eukprot:NP_001326185.1 AIG2-like (avirulence induced gene) family protein [Arabidopsis thaliana]
MTSSDQSPSHDVFVYGSFQEPAVVNLILECAPVMVSAQLHGYHLYRLKGRLHPCISPSDNGLINGKILTGLTDSQLESLDMIEGTEYVRKTVEVVLTDTLEKKQVETIVWANKDDPNMYGEWDFEEWKRLHMEKFIEAATKFMEWKKNPNGRSREEFEKFVQDDSSPASA